MAKKISPFEGLYLWKVGYSYTSLGTRYSSYYLFIVTKARSFEEARLKAEQCLEQSAEYDEESDVRIEKIKLLGTVDA